MPTGLMLFDVVEVIGSLIQAHVTDLNTSRPKNKWVFPEFPEEDSNLPEVVVKLGNPDIMNDSAGNFLYSEYDSENEVFKEYYYKKVSAPVRLIVITKKTQNDSVKVTFNNSDMYLKNKPLNIYLTEQVKHMFWQRRGDVLDYFDDFKMENIESAFDNNKWSWGSIINCIIEYKDCFRKDTDSDGIVKEYNLGMLILE